MSCWNTCRPLHGQVYVILYALRGIQLIRNLNEGSVQSVKSAHHAGSQSVEEEWLQNVVHTEVRTVWSGLTVSTDWCPNQAERPFHKPVIADPRAEPLSSHFWPDAEQQISGVFEFDTWLLSDAHYLFSSLAAGRRKYRFAWKELCHCYWNGMHSVTRLLWHLTDLLYCRRSPRPLLPLCVCETYQISCAV